MASRAYCGASLCQDDFVRPFRLTVDLGAQGEAIAMFSGKRC